MNILLSEDFATALGTIRTRVESDGAQVASRNTDGKLQTTGYLISLQSFDLKRVWNPGEMPYEAGIGWRCFIEKINGVSEALQVHCALAEAAEPIEANANSGEGLDAIEIENSSHQLHIGTEDGECLRTRALLDQWMPARFAEKLGLDASFTQYTETGFTTEVPALAEGERIYFHYLVTVNHIKNSATYPDERDVSTWYAVDQSMAHVDECLGRHW